MSRSGDVITIKSDDGKIITAKPADIAKITLTTNLTPKNPPPTTGRTWPCKSNPPTNCKPSSPSTRSSSKATPPPSSRMKPAPPSPSTKPSPKTTP